MANAALIDQQPPLGVFSSDVVEAVEASYRTHRQNGDSELASYQAALSAYLNYFGRQSLETAVKAVRMIIRKDAAGQGPTAKA